VHLNVAEFTAVVGRNDVGKSTLLEALDIFFNHKNIKLDRSDPCVHNEGKVVEIACIFEELPATITIDARSETTLQREWLLNAKGQLEIQKRFDCRPKTPKEEVFACAVSSTHPQLVDLLKLKNAGLKERARAVNADLSQVDERSNAALREAIRAAVGEVEMTEQLVALNEEDGKKAWDQIELELPAFALFQADRPSKDDDPEVADPMKVAVAEAVKAVQAELDEIKERVRQSAMDVANRTLEKLREMDPALANELTPSFKAEPKWDGFKLTLASDNEIPINKRGSGVRRLILLSFFRAEAERRRTASQAKRVIYAIEEPESSQHPDSQQVLIRTLLELGEDAHTQGAHHDARPRCRGASADRRSSAGDKASERFAADRAGRR
jgi:putative ATP-dependent endonuclease of OLD family